MEKIGVGLVAYMMSSQEIFELSKSLDTYNFSYRVVVDNSPTTNSKSVFEENNWTYLSRMDNPGFGFSHNLIFEQFADLHISYHLVINPDITFKHGVIEELIRFMDNNKNAGAVTPAVYYPNGEFQELRKLLPSPYGWFLRRFRKNSRSLEDYNNTFELRKAPRDGVFRIPYMSGCFMLLRTSAIKEIGFFDSKIFMYGEDTDLSRRLWLEGKYPYYYGKVSIVHKFAKGSHKSLKLLFVAIKASIYYFNKWGWIDAQRKAINEECLKQFK